MKTQAPTHEAPSSKTALFADQHVSLTLRAPQNQLVFWTMAAVYLLTITLSGTFVLFFLALMTLPYKSPHANNQGMRSLWLCIVGLVAAAQVLSVSRQFKPEGLNVYEWWNLAPGSVVMSIAAVLAAALIALWHVSWLMPTAHSTKTAPGETL